MKTTLAIHVLYNKACVVANKPHCGVLHIDIEVISTPTMSFITSITLIFVVELSFHQPACQKLEA